MKKAAPPLLAAALLLSGAASAHDRVSTKLSWQGDVSRIVRARCVSCHAPAADSRVKVPDLTTYAAARPWARAIREVILDGHGYSAASGGALTPFERELLVQWIDGGAPETPKFFPVDFSRLPSTYRRIASPDPLGTLDEYQQRLGGTRAIVPGLGLTLRAPTQLIVVERAAVAEERVIARGTFVPSLSEHLAALPSTTSRTRVSDAAYVIGPLDEPRSEVAEIEPEGPDRFWCPMHPDARRPAPGRCPRCGMPLVEIPPMSLDAFALSIVRTEAAGDTTRVTMAVTRDSDPTPVSSFQTVHERPFHLFVVDEALETFQHVHPDIVAGTLSVTVDARPGTRYRLIGDFVPVDALPQLRMVGLPGRAGPAGRGAAAAPPTVRATLMPAEWRKGRVGRVAFDVTDASSGAPADLEPYLGAAAHLFIIDEALVNPLHAHPVDLPQGSPSRPAFDVRFPRAGRYVMWLQVQRGGRVETLRFTAEVVD